MSNETKTGADGSLQDFEANGKFGIQSTVTDNTTLVQTDSGLEVNIGTDAKAITLPKITASNLGMNFLLRNIGADGNNTARFMPNALDSVHGTIVNAASDSVASGVAAKYFQNTKATANKGDYCIVKAVAYDSGTDAGTWAITGGVGIWASEA